MISNVSCPQIGIYKSSSTYRPLIPVSTCTTGVWALSIGCELTNKSELTFSSTCRHETVPDVQIITSIKGICLASWRTDHRFQRTIILYEQNRAFCLVTLFCHLSFHYKSFLCIDSTIEKYDSKLDHIRFELHTFQCIINQCRE